MEPIDVSKINGGIVIITYSQAVSVGALLGKFDRVIYQAWQDSVCRAVTGKDGDNDSFIGIVDGDGEVMWYYFHNYDVYIYAGWDSVHPASHLDGKIEASCSSGPIRQLAGSMMNKAFRCPYCHSSNVSYIERAFNTIDLNTAIRIDDPEPEHMKRCICRSCDNDQDIVPYYGHMNCPEKITLNT